ncbi:hypothetical protein, partial [Bradyrhizobium sp. 150]|uniref:hypothetical protein n=1 Tax=Bradyrhizobium sp. 150 TaxID=2782625 RepID=UPI001FFB8A16
DHRLPSQGVHLFWWTPHASEHSKAKGAGKFALTSKSLAIKPVREELLPGFSPLAQHRNGPRSHWRCQSDGVL